MIPADPALSHPATPPSAREGPAATSRRPRAHLLDVLVVHGVVGHFVEEQLDDLLQLVAVAPPLADDDHLVEQEQVPGPAGRPSARPVARALRPRGSQRVPVTGGGRAVPSPSRSPVPPGSAAYSDPPQVSAAPYNSPRKPSLAPHPHGSRFIWAPQASMLSPPVHGSPRGTGPHLPWPLPQPRPRAEQVHVEGSGQAGPCWLMGSLRCHLPGQSLAGTRPRAHVAAVSLPAPGEPGSSQARALAAL